MMQINCIWEHNGADSLLYAENFIGAFTRGESLDVAKSKMHAEIWSYMNWTGKSEDFSENIVVHIRQEKESDLEISDADRIMVAS